MTLAERIRFWAMRHPRPASFRVHSGAADKPSLVELGPRVTWARVSETLAAMDPEMIEALAVNGSVIRACKPLELGDTVTDEPSTTAPTAAADYSGGGAAFDAETARFNQFSTLLSKAYTDAQAQVGLRNGAVFDRMIDLFETLAQQSKDQAAAIDTQQKTISKLYEQQIKDAFARANKAADADAEPSLIDQLAETFLKHAGGGHVEPDPEDEAAPVGATNGKGPH